jgi:hypothetical protein
MTVELGVAYVLGREGGSHGAPASYEMVLLRWMVSFVLAHRSLLIVNLLWQPILFLVTRVGMYYRS